MKCSQCKRPEIQTTVDGRKRAVKDPKDVTAIICSTCIATSLMQSRRRSK